MRRHTNNNADEETKVAKTSLTPCSCSVSFGGGASCMFECRKRTAAGASSPARGAVGRWGGGTVGRWGDGASATAQAGDRAVSDCLQHGAHAREQVLVRSAPRDKNGQSFARRWDGERQRKQATRAVSDCMQPVARRGETSLVRQHDNWSQQELPQHGARAMMVPSDRDSGEARASARKNATRLWRLRRARNGAERRARDAAARAAAIALDRRGPLEQSWRRPRETA